jgi:formyl-CoA transferase
MLNEAGVPAGPVLSVPEVVDHPQIRARGAVRDFAHVDGVGRAVPVMRGGFTVSGGEAGAAMPPPRLGADTDAVLRELGYDDRAIAKLREAKAI